MVHKTGSETTERKQESIDAVVIDYLMAHEGGARWTELKNARTENPILDAVLKKAIDRLIIAKQIVPRAELVDGKARTLYCLSVPKPELPLDVVEENWKQFIETTAKELEKARDALSAFDAQLNITAPTPPEFWLPYLKANEEIGRKVCVAVVALSTVILDILSNYSLDDDTATAERYLKGVTDTYLPKLIRDIAKLTPPGSKFEDPAVQIAFVGLCGEGAIKKYVKQMRKEKGL